MLVAMVTVCQLPAFGQNNGQVITSGDGFSYALSTPAAWESIPGKAREQGLRMIMVPKGAAWESSQSVIYSNVIPMSIAKQESVYDIIDYDLDMYKLADGGLQVSDGDRIEVNRGKGSAIVIKVHSPKMGTWEAIAYMQQSNQVPFVVMSSVDKASFERDYAAFTEVVSSFKYYDNMTVVRGK